jgi:hypothetical protein
VHYSLCKLFPYCSKAALEGSKTVSADLVAAGIQNETNKQVMQLVLILLLCLAS